MAAVANQAVALDKSKLMDTRLCGDWPERAGGFCCHKASSHAKTEASVRHDAAPLFVV